AGAARGAGGGGGGGLFLGAAPRRAGEGRPRPSPGPLRFVVPRAESMTYKPAARRKRHASGASRCMLMVPRHSAAGARHPPRPVTTPAAHHVPFPWPARLWTGGPAATGCANSETRRAVVIRGIT